MRTDNDSWDIADSVGITAVATAAVRAAESARADALFHDPYAGILLQAAGRVVGAETLENDSDPKHLPVAAIAGYIVGRTVYFDDYFAAATAAGIRQVVILAAGLDARAYRLTWPAGTVVFELDQPKVLEFKANVLANETPAADRREVPVDLRDDWPAVLRAAGFDDAAPTAWLAEGLLRYLRREDQDRLLTNMFALSAPGSQVALNTGTGRATMMGRVVRARFEKLAYQDDRSDLATWFAEHGWTVSISDHNTVLGAHGRAVTELEGDDHHRQLITALHKAPAS